MTARSRKNSMNFKALNALHNGRNCGRLQKAQLKRMGMINSTFDLTSKGKLAIYAGILDIPTVSLKILSLLYVHKKYQIKGKNKTQKYRLPMAFDFLESAISPLSRTSVYRYIQYLKDDGLVFSAGKTYVMLTDSACALLKKYDADISFIADRI